MHIHTTTLNYGGKQPQETILTLRHSQQNSIHDFIAQFCVTQIEALNRSTDKSDPWIRVIDTRSDIRITPDRVSIAGAHHLTGNVLMTRTKIGKAGLKGLYAVLESLMSQQVREQAEKNAQEKRGA